MSSTKPSTPDAWGSASAKYAAISTTVTRPAAESLVAWVNNISPFSAPNVDVFDNGCGMGVVTSALSSGFPGVSILAGDHSPGMVKTVQKMEIRNVRTQVVDASDLKPLKDNSFTHVLSTFMVQFTPAPLESLKEMYRVTTVGGTLGLAMWGYSTLYKPWIEACSQFEPGYNYPHTWTPDWEQDEKLKTYIAQAGFHEIQMKTLKLNWNFEGPEALCDYFLGSKNPEFERAIQPWKEDGRYDKVKAVYKRLVVE